jgi:hypothetical protein
MVDRLEYVRYLEGSGAGDGKVSVRSSCLTAYTCGNIGWVADQPVMTLESGVEIAMRPTGVT